MDAIIAHLQSAKSMVSNAMSTSTVSLSETLLFQGGEEGGDSDSSEDESRPVGGAAAVGMLRVSNEDRLLDALESGNDKLYDQLIDPSTGNPFTEAEKREAVLSAIDREIQAIESNRPISASDQARLDELNGLSESVERSQAIDTLFKAGVPISENPAIIDDLGNQEATDAFVDIFTSDAEVDQNTADAIIDGELQIINIDNIRIDTGGVILVDDDGDGVPDRQLTPDTNPELFDLDGDGIISEDERIDAIVEFDDAGNPIINEVQFIDHPDDGVRVISAGAAGFNEPGSTDIFISTTDANGNPLSEEEIASVIVHEANHALNPFPPEIQATLDDLNDPAVADTVTDEQRAEVAVAFYESEFRAYWVDGTFDHLEGEDKAAAINNLILESGIYTVITDVYDVNPDIAAEIDAITEPNGNLNNET